MRTEVVLVNNTVMRLVSKAAKSRRKRVVENERPDRQDIDLGDIPEVKDRTKAVVGKFHTSAKSSLPARPPKSRK